MSEEHDVNAGRGFSRQPSTPKPSVKVKRSVTIGGDDYVRIDVETVRSLIEGLDDDQNVTINVTRGATGAAHQFDAGSITLSVEAS